MTRTAEVIALRETGHAIKVDDHDELLVILAKEKLDNEVEQAQTEDGSVYHGH